MNFIDDADLDCVYGGLNVQQDAQGNYYSIVNGLRYNGTGYSDPKQFEHDLSGIQNRAESFYHNTDGLEAGQTHGKDTFTFTDHRDGTHFTERSQYLGGISGDRVDRSDGTVAAELGRQDLVPNAIDNNFGRGATGGDISFAERDGHDVTPTDTPSFAERDGHDVVPTDHASFAERDGTDRPPTDTPSFAERDGNDVAPSGGSGFEAGAVGNDNVG